MATAHFNPPPAKRVKVQCDHNPHPRWLLVPTASRTVHDLLESLLLRLGLPASSAYDLCLDGAPILPDEDIALVRDGEQLHLRQRHTPPVTPTHSQPSLDHPHMSATSTPDNLPPQKHRKRRRVLTAEGKRRRNARNRQREKRRRLELHQSQQHPTPHTIPPSNTPLLNHSQTQRSSPEDHPRPAERDLPQHNNPPAPHQSNSPREETERDPMPAKQHNHTSLPPTHRTEREPPAQHVPEANGVADVEMVGTPTSTVPIGNLASSKPAKCPAPTAPVCSDASAQKPNPRLSYVFLQKVSIQPFAIKVPQTSTGGQRNERENPSRAIRKTAALTPPSDARLEESQTATGRTSGLIRVETTSSAEKTTVGECPSETRKKPSAAETNGLERIEGVEEPVVVAGSKDVSAQGRKRPLVKVAEAKVVRGRTATEITAANTRANSNGPSTLAAMDLGNGSVDNLATAAALPPPSETGIQESSNIRQNLVGEPKDNVDLPKKTNPRWKRRRPRGDKGSRDTPDSAKAVKGSWNNEQTLSSDRKSTDSNQAHELGMQASANQSRKVGPPVTGATATRAKESECDVINLVDDDENDAHSFDSLPAVHRSGTTENRAKSTSPQSIVLSPAEPQAGNPDTGRRDIEALKTCSSNLAKESVESVVGAERERRCQEDEAGSARASRRKPTRPRELNKPETVPILKTVNTTMGALSREVPHHHEDLETLKQAAVRDLEAAKLGAPIESNILTPLRAENPVHGMPGSSRIPKAKESRVTPLPAENAVHGKPESGRIQKAKKSSKSNVRSDAKQRRNALKGGLSTLAAVRVAKAHAAIRLSAPKENNDSGLTNNGSGPSNAPVITGHETRTIDSEERPVTDFTRKKSKRSKRRSRKALQYLHEEQVNRSTFVGIDSRPETLLPPLELLDFPMGTDDHAQDPRVGENLPESCAAGQSCFEAHSDARKVQYASQAQPSDITVENPPFLVPTEAIPSKHNQSFDNLNGQQHPVAGPRELEDVLQVTDASIQGASPAPQTRDGTNIREIASPGDHPIQSTNANSFRKDLVHVLQHTTQELAKVWSKWDDCQ